MKTYLTSYLLGMLLVGSAVAQAQPVVETWVRRYNTRESGADDRAFKVVADKDGNVIVAGSTDDLVAGPDMLILKYSGAGMLLWANRYRGPDRASTSGLAVDKSGNIFVTGSSDGGYATIAYSETGAPLWTNLYRGPANGNDFASAVAVDNHGHVFVTGSSQNSEGDFDYVTIAYSGAGVALWTNRYDGPANRQDYAAGIDVDHKGNVFVTGYSSDEFYVMDYETIAYSGAGIALWTNRAEGCARAVAVNSSGNVFVTGSPYTIAYSGAGEPLWTNEFSGQFLAVDNSGNVFVTGGDWFSGATIAYSGAGSALWTNYYHGTQGHYLSTPTAVAVDNTGNVFVSGYAVDGGGGYPYVPPQYVTLAYSGTGVPLWINSYDETSFFSPAPAMAVDNSGNVFVAGYSPVSPYDQRAYDCVTIAYSAAGVGLWTNRYDGPADGDGAAAAVVVDNSGKVFVTGSSSGSGGSWDYVTIAYSSEGVAQWTNRSVQGFARAMVLNNSGNVFVTGTSMGGYATVAYSNSGMALWTNRYEGPTNGYYFAASAAVAVDNGGNVVVTGTGYQATYYYPCDDGPCDPQIMIVPKDIITIAYSGAGVPLWTNRLPGGATALAVDNSSNVFVTGSSAGDYATIAYSVMGVPLWTNRYNGPSNGWDYATAVAVDNSGNVFVTGYSSAGRFYDYVTIAYSNSGVALWTNCYDGTAHGYDSARPAAIAVDYSGNVFVTGTGYVYYYPKDIITIAYSGAGIALWTNRYNGPANGPDAATAMAVDNSGNVILTGNSQNSRGDADYVTIAYSAAGVALWTNRYDGPGRTNDYPWAMAVDNSGNIFVTGSSGSFGPRGNRDYATVKYVWRPQLAIQPLTAGSSTVNLTLSGAANSSWSIERALGITGPWTKIGTSLIATNSLGLFQDANPPAKGAFYRAAQP